MKLAIILVGAIGIILLGSNAFAEPNSQRGSGDPIYMNYQGINAADLNGDGCTGIQLDSFQWGFTTSTQSATGGAGSGKVAVHDISITKSTDKSSPLLVQQAISGKSSPVKIDFCKRAGGGKILPFMEYNLENVLISSYNISSGGDRPTDSITLNFAKIKFSFFDYGPDGTLRGTTSTFFDVFTSPAT